MEAGYAAIDDRSNGDNMAMKGLNLTYENVAMLKPLTTRSVTFDPESFELTKTQLRKKIENEPTRNNWSKIDLFVNRGIFSNCNNRVSLLTKHRIPVPGVLPRMSTDDKTSSGGQDHCCPCGKRNSKCSKSVYSDIGIPLDLSTPRSEPAVTRYDLFIPTDTPYGDKEFYEYFPQ